MVPFLRALTLTITGASEEAIAVADGLIEAAEATRNPSALCFALLAYGFAFRDADPGRALAALRRGLVLAQDSGNRNSETHLAAVLCRAEAKYGDPLAALHYFGLAIHNHHESGNTTSISTPLAMLAAFFDQLGRYESAATIAGFALSPLTATGLPIATFLIQGNPIPEEPEAHEWIMVDAGAPPQTETILKNIRRRSRSPGQSGITMAH